MRVQELLIVVGLCVSGTTFAEDSGAWVHIKDAKDDFLLGTVHGHPPATYGRDATINSPAFQVSFVEGGVQIRDGDGHGPVGADARRRLARRDERVDVVLCGARAADDADGEAVLRVKRQHAAVVLEQQHRLGRDLERERGGDAGGKRDAGRPLGRREDP